MKMCPKKIKRVQYLSQWRNSYKIENLKILLIKDGFFRYQHFKKQEIFKSRNKMKNYIFICIEICLIIV